MKEISSFYPEQRFKHSHRIPYWMAGWQILVLKFWRANPYKVLWLTTLLLKSSLKFKFPRQFLKSQYSSLGRVSSWEQQTQHRTPCMQCYLLYAVFISFLKKRFNCSLPWKRLFSGLLKALKQCLQASACQVLMFAGGGPAHGQGTSSCWRGQAADVLWVWRGTWERMHPTQRDNLNV